MPYHIAKYDMGPALLLAKGLSQPFTCRDLRLAAKAAGLDVSNFTSRFYAVSHLFAKVGYVDIPSSHARVAAWRLADEYFTWYAAQSPPDGPITDFLSENGESSFHAIKTRLGLNNTILKSALRRLRKAGKVVCKTPHSGSHRAVWVSL